MATREQTASVSLSRFAFIWSAISTLRSKISLLYSNKPSQAFGSYNSLGKNNLKKYLPVVIIGIFALLTVGFVVWTGYYAIKNLVTRSSGVSVLGAKASQEINKEFSFPIYNDEGKEVSSLKYEIRNAEFRDEIITQGKRAISVKGRTFLVLNLKIHNEYNQSVKINTRDYVRLFVNNQEEKDGMAASAHSDPVEVQPISILETKLGFAINDSDKNLMIKVGEINGPKQELELNLK